LKTYEIPSSTRTAKGQAIVNFLQISPEEKITAVTQVAKDTQAEFMIMQTVQGKTKKVKLTDFEKVRRSGLIAINLAKDDSLGWVEITSGKDEIIIATSEGQAIRFTESQIRPMGRSAAGVKGINLRQNDQVVSLNVVEKTQKKSDLLVISENGYGKRTSLTNYKNQSRGGIGIKTMQLTTRTGKLISAQVTENNTSKDLIASSNKGQIIRTAVSDISTLGRATQGVRVMKLKKYEQVVAVAVV
jgi:DNA gyrase subunit A